MTGRVRVGTVGAGSLGYHHIRILRELEGVEYVGFYERNAQRAAQVAGELGVRAFGSLDELLSRVEAAVVAVPTTDHATVSVAALEAGVNLLIEKPIAAALE